MQNCPYLWTDYKYKLKNVFHIPGKEFKKLLRECKISLGSALKFRIGHVSRNTFFGGGLGLSRVFAHSNLTGSYCALRLRFSAAGAGDSSRSSLCLSLPVVDGLFRFPGIICQQKTNKVKLPQIPCRRYEC
jgi:hypothetical protein